MFGTTVTHEGLSRLNFPPLGGGTYDIFFRNKQLILKSLENKKTIWQPQLYFYYKFTHNIAEY